MSLRCPHIDCEIKWYIKKADEDFRAGGHKQGYYDDVIERGLVRVRRRGVRDVRNQWNEDKYGEFCEEHRDCGTDNPAEEEG